MRSQPSRRGGVNNNVDTATATDRPTPVQVLGHQTFKLQYMLGAGLVVVAFGILVLFDTSDVENDSVGEMAECDSKETKPLLREDVAETKPLLPRESLAI